MPRGDDEDTDNNKSSSSSSSSSRTYQDLPPQHQARSTRPDSSSQPMFLPEQTPSSSSSHSIATSTSASAAHRTPAPLPPPVFPLQQIPADHHRPGSDYDMHLIEGDSLDEAERAARRWRAHGKRRQRDDIAPLAQRAGAQSVPCIISLVVTDCPFFTSLLFLSPIHLRLLRFG